MRQGKGLNALGVYRERAGGPREGGGAEVTDAMCAATTGRSACASGEGLATENATKGNGGDTLAHMGHSMPAEV